MVAHLHARGATHRSDRQQRRSAGSERGLPTQWAREIVKAEAKQRDRRTAINDTHPHTEIQRPMQVTGAAVAVSDGGQCDEGQTNAVADPAECNGAENALDFLRCQSAQINDSTDKQIKQHTAEDQSRQRNGRSSARRPGDRSKPEARNG